MASGKEIIKVEVVTGPMDGLRHYTMGRRLLIGRSRDADLRLEKDQKVSARHAFLEIKQGMLWLQNLEAPGGTLIGNVPVRDGVSTPLSVGVTFTVGNTMIEVLPEDES